MTEAYCDDLKSRAWVNCSDCLPRDTYRLMTLLTEDGKELMGWYNGYLWDGLKIGKDTKIVKWKKNRVMQ